MKISIAFIGFAISVLAAPLQALTPMEYYNSLVAGGSDAGWRDGEFDQARFNHPCGLAFDPTGSKLFVADRYNNRIRVIDLDHENQVGTVMGTGQEGQTDGPISQANFNMPSALAYLPGDRLAVFDAGSGRLRLVDLSTRMVSTLAGNSPDSPALSVWNLVYWPKDNSLYFSEPDQGRIQKYDFKAKSVSTVLSDDPKVPAPKALCLMGGQLLVADRNLPSVYQVGLEPQTGTVTAHVSLYELGKGERIREMAASGDNLYALEDGPQPLVEILPSSQAVSLDTAWGYFMENDNEEAAPLLQFEDFQPIGFAASPQEDRKLYVGTPNVGLQAVLSLKDYHFGGPNAFTQPTMDFDYPAAKPPKTYRILVVGDSRLATAPLVFDKYSPNHNPTPDPPSLRAHTFAKRMEFWLNVEASLKGVDLHYEVLTLAHPNQCPLFFSNYEVPAIVEKYDIDAVYMLDSFFYQDYFDKPSTAEGIPAHDFDPEFLLKPLKERVLPGPARKFFQDCEKKGLFQPGTVFPDYTLLLKLEDPQIREDVMEMLARPLRLFLSKLQATRPKDGHPPQFLTIYVPWSQLRWNEEDYRFFWRDLCLQTHVTEVDLGQPYQALKLAFYPTEEYCCSRHYTAYSHELIAYLLTREILDQKLIPFEPAQGVGSKSVAP